MKIPPVRHVRGSPPSLPGQRLAPVNAAPTEWRLTGRRAGGPDADRGSIRLPSPRSLAAGQIQTKPVAIGFAAAGRANGARGIATGSPPPPGGLVLGQALGTAVCAAKAGGYIP